MGKVLKLRQQIVGTAAVFFMRYHARRPLINRKLKHIDAELVAATCIYLAAKVEEHPFHIKSIVQAVQSSQVLGPTHSIDTVRISECEFHLMEALDFYMVVFHPYNSVVLFIRDLSLPKEQATIFLQNAWMLVNDTFRSDLPLLYPPHMIALGVIYLTAAMQEKNLEAAAIDFGAWFARLNVGVNDVLVLVQQLLDVYQIMSTHTRERAVEILNRLKQQPQ
ncbi:hypothetical protein HDU98_004372 [Podochytrium sp. JEL0797]|nr:hypothetical protein HDU98_004372 [Podochytrium sp. JEL0797]